jgi:pilus assembly protein CpaF
MTSSSSSTDLAQQIRFQIEINQRLAPIRSNIYDALMLRIDPNAAIRMSRDELHHEVEQFVIGYILDHGVQLNRREQRQVALDIVHDMIGFGPLEIVLQDDEVTDVMVNGPNEVYVERRGKIEKSWLTFRDQPHILQIAQRIANRIGRRIDESSPMVDARLPDGSRVNIITNPVSLNGTVISIRKFSKGAIDMNTMVKQGNISESVAEFLRIAMICRLNVIVSGGTGSGKTTLLNAISQKINPAERIVTIEDAAELKLQQPHIVRLETRPANIEGEGAITIRDLVKNALRMRPDRIIVGEVRGDETIDMLQAMNTGHDGSMSTIHANMAQEALFRLENMIAISTSTIPSKVIRSQISGGIDLIVHIARMRDGIRRIQEIIEVNEMEGDNIKTTPLFNFQFLNEDEYGFLQGQFKPSGVIPSFMEKAHYYGLAQDLEKTMK